MYKNSLGVIALAATLITPASYAIQIEERVYRPGNRFNTVIDTRLLYNDNYLYKKDDEVSSWSAIVEPKVDYQFDDESYAIAAYLETELGFYEENSDDNYADLQFGAAYQFKIGGNQRLKLSGNWHTFHEARGQGLTEGRPDTITEPDEIDRYDTSVGYEFGSLSGRTIFNINGGLGKQEYTTREAITESQNYDFYYARAKASYLYSGKTHLTALIDYRDISYDVAKLRDSTEYVYLVGLKWESSGATEGHALLGYYEKDIDQNYDGTSWDIGVNWDWKTYSRFALSSGRKLEESDDVQADFVEDDNVEMTWTHFWRTDVSTRSRIELRNESFIGDDYERDQSTNTAEVELRYGYKQYIIGKFGVGYEKRDDDFDVRDYSQTIYSIGVEIRI